MAREALTPQEVAVAGTQPTHVPAVEGGHKFPNAGDVILIFTNDSTSSVNVTIVTDFTEDGLELPDRTVAVPVGEERAIARLSREVYNQKTGEDRNSVLINYSAHTDVTVAALRV